MYYLNFYFLQRESPSFFILISKYIPIFVWKIVLNFLQK